MCDQQHQDLPEEIEAAEKPLRGHISLHDLSDPEFLRFEETEQLIRLAP